MSRGASWTGSLWLATIVAAQLVVFAPTARARPGGGHSYSGSSSSRPSSASSSHSSYSPSHSSYSSYSSSSRSSYTPSGSSGETTWVDILFLIAMAGVAGGTGLLGAYTGIRDIIRDERESRRLTQEYETILRAPAAKPKSKPASTGWSVRERHPRSRRPKLRDSDPNFSLIVFEDLVFRLYAAAYLRAGPGGDLDGLAPYLALEVRLQLREDLGRHGQASGVAIGSLSAGKVALDDARQTVTVDIESNVSFTDQTQYLVERWTFARGPGTVTRPPEAVMQLGCPACGAPFRSSDHRRCAHCDTVVDDGRFEWQVVRREVRERRRMPPTLTRSIVEVGTDAPTIVQSQLARRLQELAGDAPGGAEATLAAIRERGSEIFRLLNAGWDARDLPALRPLLSDALFDTMRYWLAAYAARGLHNRVEQAIITCIEPARVRRDAFFDAITLRVFARCLDYTLDHDGDVVSGSRREPRNYSEYWTLIRGRHPGERRGGAGQCPGCAAPLQLTMAGHCEHCGRHLTLGEFDWVLAKIEQDEAYRG